MRDTPGLLDFSAEARGRALLIAQAIADECGRQGYIFGLCDEDEPGFQITKGDARCVFTLAEEFEPGEVVDSEKLAAAKYGWQRIPSSVLEVRSGRLILRLQSGYGSVFWADRKRWSFEEKLPAVFKEITDRITAQVQARERARTERLRRRQTWEEAVPRAKLAYIDEVNRGRLHRQVARSAEAQALRDYCARPNAVATTCDDPRRAEQIREWMRSSSQSSATSPASADANSMTT